ncbi:transglycosylase SLT domain-containing protein [Candidatus Parcubacteria bacterium]|nr:transglycosylase SLT domain-containing protein [Candidatus Parcubacteria bacterium]
MNNLAIKHFTTGTVLFAFLLPVFQVPAALGAHAKPVLEQLVTSPVIKPVTEIETAIVVPIANLFFGEEVSTMSAQSTIKKQVAFVSSRKAYGASLSVIEKHAETIRVQALEHGVPLDVAIGVALLENGGSETAKSSAGALGIYQLMPRTAKNLGLTVNKKTDERRIPEKNIGAGLTYLRQNYDRFGDWGLATWAYHAGEGNVAKALKIYAKTHDGITLPGVENSLALKNYVEKHDVTIHKLLSDAGVKKFTAKLNDDTAGYPYKVIATATLFKQAN